MTPENLVAIPQAYEEWRKKPEVIAAYGKEGTEFPASVWNSQATTAAALKAMQLAMTSPLTPVEQYRPKRMATMTQAQENALERQFRQFEYDVNKINLIWGQKVQPGINAEAFVNEAYDDDVIIASNNNGVIPVRTLLY